MTPTKILNNPYFRLPLSFNPDSYYGPSRLVEKLCEIITMPDSVPVELTGLPGLGKSTILRYLHHSKGAFIRYGPSLQPPFNKQPHLLFPILLDLKQSPANVSFFVSLYRRFHEEYQDYKKRTLSLFRATLPEITLRDPLERDVTNLIESDLYELNLHGIRPVLLLDDFDLIFEKMTYNETTRMRPWRAYVSLVLCTEKPLQKVNLEAAGSPFFASSPHLYVDGLNKEEQLKLILEPAASSGIVFPLSDVEYLIEQVGNHPFLLLLACKNLWDVREDLGILMDEEKPLHDEHRLLLKARLSTEFSGSFNLFLSHLEHHELQMLLQLARGNTNKILPDDYIKLAILSNYRLIVLDTHGNYQPFSVLFKEFLISRNSDSDGGDDVQSPTEFTGIEKRLFEYLNDHSDRVCTFEELWIHVWQNAEGDPKDVRRRIQVTISRLRSKMYNSPLFKGKDILSIREQGYRVT